jgi:hypothetical protein
LLTRRQRQMCIRDRDSIGSPNEALSRNLSNAIATVQEQITNLNQDLAQS